MNRQQVIDDIKETLGKVPGFIQSLPDDTLENEWGLFKRFELQETSIPPKYRELMGLTAASVLHCWYCALFHKAMAQMHGATEEEIQEAVHLAKFTNGWSTYLNGSVYDKDKYTKELHDIGEYVMAHTTN
jgi:AhpD family alkylhydroperoxidase